MDTASQIALIGTILENHSRGIGMPERAPVAVPVIDFCDPALHRREIERVFMTTPMMLAHSSQLASAGDFIAREVLGVPVLLARDSGGVLRGFINVCRHRGAPACTMPAGNARTFRCPVHGWTYRLDGSLASTPAATGLMGVDPATLGLTPLPVAERHGLVWAKLQPGPALDIDAFLGALAPELAALGLDRLAAYAVPPDEAPADLRRRMNWKLMCHMFLEAYHIPHAHPGSIAPLFMTEHAVHRRFGLHSCMIMPEKTMLGLRATDRAAWRLRGHATLVYFLFPNTVILAEAKLIAISAVWPCAADDSMMISTMLTPRDLEANGGAAYWRGQYRLVRRVLEEDYSAGEAMQRGMASGAQEHVTLGRYEESLAWFHESLRAALQ